MASEAKGSQSLSVGSEVSIVAEEGGIGKAYCKCGEGWKCEIKRTQGPDAGKTFVNCGHNCICILQGSTADGGLKLQQWPAAEGSFEGAFCQCGEGWSCTISKIEPTAKPFSHCAGDCSCITPAA